MKLLIVIALLPLLLLGCQEDKKAVVKPQPAVEQAEVLKAELTDAAEIKRLVVSKQKSEQSYRFSWVAPQEAVKYRVRYELVGSYFEQEVWSKTTEFTLSVANGETYNIEIVAANSNNQIIAKTNGFSVTNKMNMLNDLAK